jgi:hypothetical protein
MPLITTHDLSQRQRDRDTAAALALLLSGRIASDDAAMAVKLWRIHGDPRFHGLLTGVGFRWNPIRQMYFASNGKPITAKQLKDISLAFTDAVSEDVALDADPKKKEKRRGLIVAFYVVMAALAAGGFRRLIAGLIQHHRNAPSIDNSLGYLGKFEQQVEQGSAGSPAQVAARAKLYWAYGNAIFEETKRRSHEEAKGYDGKRQTWLEINRLGPAEKHCHTNAKTPGCIELTALGWRPLGTLPIIGARTCKNGCKCSIEYKAIDPDDPSEATMFSSDIMTPMDRLRERMLQFSAWDESKHPRGQPENKGEFAKGGASKPAIHDEAGPSKSAFHLAGRAHADTGKPFTRAARNEQIKTAGGEVNATTTGEWDAGHTERINEKTREKNKAHRDEWAKDLEDGKDVSIGLTDQIQAREYISKEISKAFGHPDGSEKSEANYWTLPDGSQLRVASHASFRDRSAAKYNINVGYVHDGLWPENQLNIQGRTHPLSRSRLSYFLEKIKKESAGKRHDEDQGFSSDTPMHQPMTWLGLQRKLAESRSFSADQFSWESSKHPRGDHGHFITIGGHRVNVKDGTIQSGHLSGKTVAEAHDAVADEHEAEAKKHHDIAERLNRVRDHKTANKYSARGNELGEKATQLRAQGARMREPAMTFAAEEGDVHFRQINTTPGENGKNHGGNTVAISNKSGNIVGGVPPAVASKLNSHITEHRQQRVDKIMGMRHGTPLDALKAKMQGMNQATAAPTSAQRPLSENSASAQRPLSENSASAQHGESDADHHERLKRNMQAHVNQAAKETSVGLRFDQLRDKLKASHPNLTPEQFKKAADDLYESQKMRLTGWPHMPEEIPDPSLIVKKGTGDGADADIHGSGKTMYYMQPGRNSDMEGGPEKSHMGPIENAPQAPGNESDLDWEPEPAAEPVHHPEHHEHLSARHHGAAAEYEKAAKEHSDHAANAKGIGNDDLHAKHTGLADQYLQKMGTHKKLGEEHAEKGKAAKAEPSTPEEHDQLAKKHAGLAKKARATGDEDAFSHHNGQQAKHFEAAKTMRAGKTESKAPAQPTPTASGTKVTDDQVHQAVKELFEKNGNDQPITIKQLRDHVKSRYGDEAASHANLDPQLKKLRGNKVRMGYAAMDFKQTPEDVKEGGVPGYQEHFTHVSPHETIEETDARQAKLRALGKTSPALSK